MADLLTHLSTTYLIKRVTYQKGMTFCLMGSIMPDLSRSVGFFIYRLDKSITLFEQKIFYLSFALHTPFGMILTSYFGALLLRERWRKLFFWNFLIGQWIHFLLDMCQTHLSKGYRWAFPFFNHSFEFKIVNTDDSILYLPIWLGLCLLAWRFPPKYNQNPWAFNVKKSQSKK
ncbi:MAG: hypothetical protein CMK59_10620 [Proteobacteria bacterium]|nr:hypothetical protein [Pseudomonadota bacterium]